MSRPVRRSVTALVAATVVALGSACTSAEGPDPTTETTEPVPVEPNQEVGEGLPPGTPDEVTGTEG